jgi:hypothetical protein
MAEDEFFLNPLIADEVGALYISSLGEKIASLKFIAADPRYLERDIALGLNRYSRNMDQALADRLRYPMMVTVPSKVESSDARALPFEENGEEVLMVQAPAEVRFGVQPGSGSVTGKYGILPGAYAVTDGVTFAISYEPESGDSQTLFERTLDPHNNDQDKGLLDLDVAYEAAQAGEIVLRTFSPPAKGAGCEWSCWTRIDVGSPADPARIAPAPAEPSDRAPSEANVSPDIEGSLDDAHCDGIDGWCWDKNRKGRAVDVEIFDGDTMIASVVCDIRRQDLVDAGISDGCHGFHLDVPPALKDGRPHVIHVRAAGVELDASPRTITCAGEKH